jgi:predicted regulator of Ras-like GTPase activity (Roadblock/LC7/MglB family)
MDAAQALADLTEISSQIEGAVLAEADGKVVASSFPDTTRGEGVARAAVRLLEEAEQIRPPGDTSELAHVQAATPEGSVFVVRDDARVIAAVTGSDPTVGLVFYDLKTCLRLAAEESAEKSRRSRAEEPAAASNAETASGTQADA